MSNLQLIQRELPRASRIKMAPAVVVSLPLQLLCQLIASGPNSNQSICGTGTVNQQPPVQIQPATLPEGYVLYPQIGVAYKFHSEIVSWRVARQECILEGGELALIDSYTKLSFVLRQRRSNNYTHVGILRMYDDEEWMSTSTGLPVSVIPWAPGEPSGHADCVMIKNDGGLGNFGCDTRTNYVCEIPTSQKYIVQTGPVLGQISPN